MLFHVSSQWEPSLIEYNHRNISLQKLCGKWGRATSSRPLFISLKSCIWGESTRSAAYFYYISKALNLSYNKSKRYKNLDYWSIDMHNFNFSEKGLELVSSPHFVCDFLKKCFSCCIPLTDHSISSSDCLYFSRYWPICVLQLFVNQAVTS